MSSSKSKDTSSLHFTWGKSAPESPLKETSKDNPSSSSRSPPNTPLKSPNQRRSRISNDNTRIDKKSLAIPSLVAVIDKPAQPRVSAAYSVPPSSTIVDHDDESMTVSKLRMDLRSAQFRLTQAESERDNLKERLQTTEAELMDLYASSPATTANVDLSTGKGRVEDKRVRGLEKENEKLKEQISELKSSNERLKEENEKLRREGGSAGTTARQSEVGLVDTISFDEITRLFETFNKETVAIARALAHHVSRSDSGGNKDKAKRQAARVLGDALVDVLLKQADKKTKLDVVFVEIIVRAFIVEVFAPEIGGWPGVTAKTGDVLAKAYRRMQQSESVVISRRWRRLTTQYLRGPTHVSSADFLEGLSSLFVCAGWALPTPRINDTAIPFLRKIDPIVAALNVAFSQQILSFDINVLLSNFNGSYSPTWANAVYLEHDGDTAHQKRVAANVSLGYRKYGPLAPDSPDPERYTHPNHCLVKPEVILTSTMEAITGIPFVHTPGHEDRNQLLSMGDGRE